jgi:TRAP-type C4-dicarboxylate transport system permease small subunit
VSAVDEQPPAGHRAGWCEAPPVRWLDRLVTALSVSALAAILITLVVSVSARYLFASPLIGSNELLQLALVALVALALLPTSRADMHIRVDVLDERIGRVGRYAGDLFTRVVCAFILFCLAYRAALQARDSAEFGDATNMLAVPLWPFYALLMFGSLSYALMLLIQGVDILRRGAREHD